MYDGTVQLVQLSIVQSRRGLTVEEFESPGCEQDQDDQVAHSDEEGPEDPVAALPVATVGQHCAAQGAGGVQTVGLLPAGCTIGHGSTTGG